MDDFYDYQRQIQETVEQMQGLITRLCTLEAGYLKQEEALFVISEFANDWEYWQDTDGRYLYVSPSCNQVTGYTPGDFYNDRNLLQQIILRDDWREWRNHSHIMRKDGVVEPLEFQIRTKEGEKRWIHHICQKVTAQDGRDLGIRGSNRDITQLKKLQEELTHMAGHDHLTGLPNRSLFLEHLSQSIKRANRENSRFIVAFIDLDGFKEINDTYGHKAGDNVLIKLAGTLSGLLRKNDIIARFGGDEFVACFEVHGEHDSATIKKRIEELIPSLISCPSYDIIIRYSLGLSLYPQDGTTIDDLLKVADQAMYAQKQCNKRSTKAGTELKG
ncbi:MAG: sensor domain-containing diguanylate cyclase [Thermodesulfobacteriota bacterium]